MRLESTGSIHITSNDPRVAPAIRFNFLSNAQDVEITLATIRIACATITAPAMQPLQVMQIAPSEVDVCDDDALLAWTRAFGETTYHPIETCKMGLDPMAVVDNRLRVHGLHGLRVADASIMPTMTSGNTNAPAIMIGEKAASMVLDGAV